MTDNREHEPIAVRISWYDERGDGTTPFESVYIPIPEDITEERFAVGGGVGTVEEHCKGHIEKHIRGECKCVSATGGETDE